MEQELDVKGKKAMKYECVLCLFALRKGSFMETKRKVRSVR